MPHQSVFPAVALWGSKDPEMGFLLPGIFFPLTCSIASAAQYQSPMVRDSSSDPCIMREALCFIPLSYSFLCFPLLLHPDSKRHWTSHCHSPVPCHSGFHTFCSCQPLVNSRGSGGPPSWTIPCRKAPSCLWSPSQLGYESLLNSSCHSIECADSPDEHN